MTVIVAYTDGTDTWIGSDRALINGSIFIIGDAGKWSLYEGWGLGLAGGHRQCEVVEAHLPELLESMNLLTPIDLSGRLAKKFREYGITPKTPEQVEEWGVDGILVRRGAVWDLDAALTPLRWPAGRILANGYGCAFAEGAAWAYQEYRRSDEIHPEDIVRVAVEAANKLCPRQCGGLWLRKL